MNYSVIVKENLNLMISYVHPMRIALEWSIYPINPILVSTAYQSYLEFDKNIDLSEKYDTYIPHYGYHIFCENIETFLKDNSSEIRKHALSKKN